jgi:molecular chaperone HtpG
MEKVLNSMPSATEGNKVHAQRILEINPQHTVFSTLSTLIDTDTDKLGKYAKILYNQALLIEGMPVEDPAEFSRLVAELMI